MKFHWPISFGNSKTRLSAGEVRSLGKVQWKTTSDEGYALEGYAQNVIVFRCVDIVAKALASIPFEVYLGDEKQPDHDLQLLLDNPNPMQSGETLLENLAAYRLITGNSYLEKFGPDGRPPNELWIWDPFRMKVLAARDARMPSGYLYDTGYSESTVGWECDHQEGACDLMHWRTFNPIQTSRFYGMSPVGAAAYQVDQHNAASEWNMRMLQNSASPEGILSTEQELTDDQFAQLMERYALQHTGPENARKMMILEGGLAWQQISMSPKDMDWLEGKNLSAREIAGSFGVPTQVIPIAGDQTFANYEQARQALYEDNVIPLAKNLARELTQFLAPSFSQETKRTKEKLHIRINIEEIPALAVKRAERNTALQLSTTHTPNEKRVLQGLDPIGDIEDDANTLNMLWFGTSILPVNGEEEKLDETLTPEEEEAILSDAGTDDDTVDPDDEEEEE